MRIDDRYSRMLEKLPTLSADDQQVLAERYARTRDQRDADKLVLGNLRLVLKLARELGGGRPKDLMDLVQEGNAGLTEAVRRFDPTRGTKVSSYAALWIRAYILRYLMATSRIAHFSSTREGRRRFFAGTLPGADVSLDASAGPAGDDGSARASRLELLADDDSGRPDVRVEEREYRACVDRAISAFRPTLDSRARAIFDQRLLRDNPVRLSELGRQLEISGERTRQLEARVIGNLRGFVTTSLGEPLPAAA